MNKKSIIIIGSGISGLSAGCYAQMNGYQSTIFEMHNIPGGLCTSWKRKGFTIDGCLHWLVGSGDTSYFHNIWKELGAINDIKMIYHDEFMRIKEDEKELILYTDINKLKKHLLEISIEDKKIINEFIKTINLFAKYELPINKPKELYNIFDIVKLFLKNFPLILSLLKYKNISMKKFAEKFKNKFLRENFPKIFDLPDFSMAIVFFHLGWMHNKSSGYPIGGSLKFSNNIAERYKYLGGKILYNTKIKKILVKNNKAVGVETENGRCFYVNKIISSIYLHPEIINYLDEKKDFKNLEQIQYNLKPFPPIIQVSLGINRNLNNTPHLTIYNLKNPIILGGIKQTLLKVEHSSYDKNLTPDNKSLLKIMFFADYNYWKSLYINKERYIMEKDNIIKIVINELENYYPGISKQIEMIDMTTPITYKRYTGNYNGSFEGWLIDTKSIDINIEKKFKDIKNFYITGHWAAIGGGVPLVALHARDLIQIICRNDRLKFRTQVA